MDNVSVFPAKPDSASEQIAIDILVEITTALHEARYVVSNLSRHELMIVRKRLGTLDLSRLDIDGMRAFMVCAEIVGAEMAGRSDFNGPGKTA